MSSGMLALYKVFFHDLPANPTSWVAVTIGVLSRLRQNALVPELLL